MLVFNPLRTFFAFVVYEFVPHQSVVNEEITTAIFHWNSRRSDEPEGALALHLVGTDMLQLHNIAERVRASTGVNVHVKLSTGSQALAALTNDPSSCALFKSPVANLDDPFVARFI